MKKTCQKLDNHHIKDLMAISEAEGFPYPITEDVARIYCQGRDATAPGVQTYGVFEDDKLVSVMTATFCLVFPCEDSPSGRIAHISGAYTLPDCRHRHYATELLTAIEADAKAFGADYLCCDSTADGEVLSKSLIWLTTPMQQHSKSEAIGLVSLLAPVKEPNKAIRKFSH